MAENTQDVSHRGLIGAAGALAAAAATVPAAAATAPKPARRFEGRVALITGGARAQGRSHAVALAREGADVVLCDILEPIASIDYPLATSADMDETARQVKAEGRKCIALKGDVRDPATSTRMVDAALQAFGKVDYLLANAGIFTNTTPVSAMSDAAFDDTIRTNLHGVFYGMRAVLPAMEKQKYGRIVVTSSQAGRMGLRNSAHYSASKWAVLGLVKSVAQEVAAKGITVNAVCPGSVASGISINPTRIRAAFPNEPDMSAEEFVRRREAQGGGMMGVPWVKPEDVTASILFLLSDQAKFMTGEVVGVTLGGLSSNSA